MRLGVVASPPLKKEEEKNRKGVEFPRRRLLLDEIWLQVEPFAVWFYPLIFRYAVVFCGMRHAMGRGQWPRREQHTSRCNYS